MDLSTHEGEIPIPIPIPIPISTTYVLHENNHHHHHPSSNGPPPPPPPLSIENPYKKIGPIVKYRECLKNHAAAIGGNATDGCGEFMPSGQEGTLEALKCSACNCHRNFHHKEVEGEGGGDYCFHHLSNGQKLIGGAHKGVLIPRPTPHSMIMPLGAIQSSESDEMEGVRHGSALMMKKRFRTKFSVEQKEKMMEFAERLGWRLQKQEEGVIQQFCQEIGVKRRVLKVWMHNNKHNLAKKAAVPPPPLPSSLNERMNE